MTEISFCSPGIVTAGGDAPDLRISGKVCFRTPPGQRMRLSVHGVRRIIAYPEEAHSWVELEKGACLALRQAKENRKNQCVEFTAGLLDELQLSHCLAQSADNGFQEFRLVFQPICGADTLEVRGPGPLGVPDAG